MGLTLLNAGLVSISIFRGLKVMGGNVQSAMSAVDYEVVAHKIIVGG